MYEFFSPYILLPQFSKNRHFFFLINYPVKLVIHLMKAIDLLDMAIYIDISRGMMLYSILI